MSTTRVVLIGPNKVRVVKVGGPPGPKGDPGGVTSVANLTGVVLPGPLAAALAPFLPGGSGASYLHTQSVPATTWTINHNLGARPVVEVRDNTGQTVTTQVVHASANQVVVTNVTAFAGSAYLTL